MSWQARIEHTPAGLALTFGAPLSRLDMAPDVAQHLASLLAVEARRRGDRQIAASDSFLPENMPVRVIGERHPLCCDCDGCLNGGRP
jgi:hypothetical protein